MDEHLGWMGEALAEAGLAAEAGDVPVGAIVVVGGVEFLVSTIGCSMVVARPKA